MLSSSNHANTNTARQHGITHNSTFSQTHSSMSGAGIAMDEDRIMSHVSGGREKLLESLNISNVRSGAHAHVHTLSQYLFTTRSATPN
jgi:hypothetical protein